MASVSAQHSETGQTTRGVRSRYGFIVMAWAMIGAVIAQVFIAGTAIFADGTRWDLHVSVGRGIEVIALVMLVLSFSGRFPATMRWITAGLVFLTTMQSGFIGLADALEIREIAAFHPVNALAIFGVSWLLASRARDIVSQRG